VGQKKRDAKKRKKQGGIAETNLEDKTGVVVPREWGGKNNNLPNDKSFGGVERVWAQDAWQRV